MSKLLRALLAVIGVAVVIGGAAAVAIVNGAMSLSPAEMEAKYRLPTSKFLTVDGTRLHYTDEGSGPPLVMLHASFMNLRSLDALATKLTQKYRVIRIDWSPAGLSGTSPDADYSVEKNLQRVRGVIEQLQLRDPVIFGTSSGGTLAFRYAAAWPDDISRLVLINTAGMPRSAATNPNRARSGPLTTWALSHYRTKSWWRNSLRGQFPSGREPPESLVELVYDQFRRAGMREEGIIALRQYRTGDPQTELGRVRAPTLVLWGEGNITVSHLEADVIAYWLTSAPSLVRKYPERGHYVYVEDTDTVAADMLAFIEGSLDGDLRVTRREPIGSTAEAGPQGSPQQGGTEQQNGAVNPPQA